MKDKYTPTIEEFNLIEHYLQGTLDAAARKRFENQLAVDKRWKKMTDEMRSMILAIEFQGLKNEMDAIHQDLKSEKVSNEERSYKIILKKYLSAAAVLFVFGTMLTLYLVRGGDGQEDLFGIDPGLPTPMSEVDDYQFYDGMVYYKEGNYHKADSLWAGLANTTIGTDTITYYRGVTNLNMNKWVKARAFLEQVPKSSVFQKQAQWRILESYFMQEDYKKAHEVIMETDLTNQPKYDEILAILKKNLE